MKISTNWINDYVKIDDVDKKELADKITNAGVNVQEVIGEINFDKIVVGEVINAKPHENSDHLKLCEVNIGAKTEQIVCGAPNARSGIKVVVSLPGAKLPNGMEIKQSVIRGVSSNGMLCSLEELGLEEKSEGIHELPNDAIVGNSPKEYLNLDSIYLLDLNPNRKNDCLNHIGFAYEVGAVLNREVKLPELNYIESDFETNIDLKVETENVLLYYAKLVKNVEIKESPEFIKQRLTNAGMRPINNVVDISNYIMLEFGQPLHFFDADKVGNTLLVRMAKDGEVITTLDKQERKLNSEDIVITDGGKPICIAGVMGGLNSDVDENTKNILIESAIFDKLKVRRTSIKLDLRSEASLRYEVGINPEYTLLALKRACHLLEKYANAKISKNEKTISKIEANKNVIEVTLEEINKVIGVKIEDEDVIDILNRLKFEYTVKDKTYYVTAPSRRLDISIKEDIIEEIGRLFGYDKIVAKLPTLKLTTGGYVPRIKYRKDVSALMKSLGFNETRTYTLISKKNSELYNYENKENIVLLKPISNDRTHVRTNLVSSLIDVLNYNESRHNDDLLIYEISNVYYKEMDEFEEDMKLCALAKGNILKSDFTQTPKVDFYYLKGIIITLLEYLGYKNRIKFIRNENITFMHKGISADILVDNKKIGFIGKLHPNLKHSETYIFEISLDELSKSKGSKIKYTAPSKYPSIKKDMSFNFSKDIIAGEVINDIYKMSSKILKNVIVFDVYDSREFRSLAFSLTYQSEERTLSDEEVMKDFENLISKISEKYNAKLRNE